MPSVTTITTILPSPKGKMDFEIEAWKRFLLSRLELSEDILTTILSVLIQKGDIILTTQGPTIGLRAGREKGFEKTYLVTGHGIAPMCKFLIDERDGGFCKVSGLTRDGLTESGWFPVECTIRIADAKAPYCTPTGHGLSVENCESYTVPKTRGMVHTPVKSGQETFIDQSLLDRIIDPTRWPDPLSQRERFFEKMAESAKEARHKPCMFELLHVFG